MRSSFDIGEFLEEKEFDIIGKTFKGGVRISSLLYYTVTRVDVVVQLSIQYSMLL